MTPTQQELLELLPQMAERYPKWFRVTTVESVCVKLDTKDELGNPVLYLNHPKEADKWVMPNYAPAACKCLLGVK